MNQDYFVHNGIKYPTGTQIKILKQPYNNPINSDLAYFLYYNVEGDTVWYRLAYTNQRRGRSMETFLKQFGGATGKVDSEAHPPIEKQLKDYQIPGLLVGWIWYIFIMAISVIFNGALGIWILATIIFFKWRKEKIQKEGYYVEW